MRIAVGHVSPTGAVVSWAPSEPCLEDHYRVVYRPNWNSLFSGYLRSGFHREERVPRALSSVALERLAPSTLYFLCVGCRRAALPDRRDCTVFHTLDESPPAARGALADPQLSLWVLLAILLACFAAVLAFICLQFWCIRCHEPRWSYRAGHAEEANGLVPWPGRGGEGELPGLPLVELPRQGSGAGAEARGGGGRPAMLPPGRE
ncbi:fibronectin type III domain-containing protein 9 [Perognathus longimembris pacificus]|uniref:fibronectin type III domain-containing protein 9 n=1 Tax=Perognathus longimembris pacificus TaxID=214514 RepID=UPI0020185CC3|nr:fibronectin type III domain-containing protein 9 [Perognathus longimembris pacificus]